MHVEEVLERIEGAYGLSLNAVGTFAGGEVGATDVRGQDGCRFALKWWDGREVGHSPEIVNALRDRGYPIPRYVIADRLDGVVVMLQEYVRGEASDDVSLEVVERLLALNALQEGVTGSQGNDWASYVAGSLRVGCNGYCMHAPLAEYDRRTAALLKRVRGAADAAEGMTQADAVHVDFHHRNVLRSGDEVIAVLDWEGARPGDAAFDLVTLRFGLSVAVTSQGARDRVWEAARAGTTAAALHAYCAHMALRQVDWSIRFRGPADVDHWLRVADELM